MVRCRSCGSTASESVLDLGTAPPSNAYLEASQLSHPEMWFPLSLFLCRDCWLLQTTDFHAGQDLFTDTYAYFSSTSDSWLNHSRSFAQTISRELKLGPDSLVLEVASNDGYLLQYFSEMNIPTLGIEPTLSTALAARTKGLRVIQDFLTADLALAVKPQYGAADLVIANNVIAHVPDLQDFIAGLSTLLSNEGVLSIEFPRVDKLVRLGQFDTVYHEHFSYFSLVSLVSALGSHGLRVFNVELLNTHGGSYRVLACLDTATRHSTQPSVGAALQAERDAGVDSVDFYKQLQATARDCRSEFLRFLLNETGAGRRVAAYGAAAKGNTLLNFCGVRQDLVQSVADRSPGKVGRYLPGSRIPIISEELQREQQPETILIFPWNIAQEISEQLAYTRSWGARLFTVVPTVRELTP